MHRPPSAPSGRCSTAGSSAAAAVRMRLRIHSGDLLASAAEQFQPRSGGQLDHQQPVAVEGDELNSVLADADLVCDAVRIHVRVLLDQVPAERGQVRMSLTTAGEPPLLLGRNQEGAGWGSRVVGFTSSCLAHICIMHMSSRRSATPLILARGGWGSVLLCAPATMLRLTRTPATPLSRGVVRVLAVRHLVVAAAGVAVHRKPRGTRRLIDRVAALADGAHATSAVALAATGHAPAAWLPDAAIATTFAVGSWRD